MIPFLLLLLEAAARPASGADGGTSNLTIALISATSAVVGALVGGGITGYTTYRIEQSRQAHDRASEEKSAQRTIEMEHRAALGIVRSLSDYLRIVLAAATTSRDSGYWWGDGSLAMSPRPRELERVLGLLTLDEWNALTVALARVDILMEYRKMTYASSEAAVDGLVDLDDQDREALGESAGELTAARNALSRVASGEAAALSE